jgi:hypothetical protein
MATAYPHYPLLSGETFRNFCDYRIDERSDLDPTMVTTGSTVFVAMSFLEYFLTQIFPQIENSFILVTSNGHGSIGQKYLPYVENEKIIRWFGRNVVLNHEKLVCIPLGIPWTDDHMISYPLMSAYFADLKLAKYFSDKPIHTYFNAQITHIWRNKIKKYFQKKSFCTVSDFVPFEEYMTHLASSRFVISPRGFNIDCFRTWEALYAGSIPVVESHGIDAVYEGLPVIIVKDLKEVTEDFLDAEFEKMKGKVFHLERLHIDYWLSQIRNAK